MNAGVYRILVVDDDFEDRSLLLDTFTEMGFGAQVAFAENGEQAIEWLQHCEQQGSLPSLVILDLNMPKLNGRQTLQFIKRQPGLAGITVVIYSTSLNPRERDECLALGAHSYVVKPITYQESKNIAQAFYEISNA